MKQSWKPPQQELSIDLEKVDVSGTGYWFCLGCHQISEPEDAGDVYLRCVHCKKPKLEWRDPVRRHTQHPQVREQVKRNFALLAAQPFHFCHGCGRITAISRTGRCILCTSEGVEVCAPATPGDSKTKPKPEAEPEIKNGFAAMRRAVAGAEGISNERKTNNNKQNEKHRRDESNNNEVRDTKPDPNAGKLWCRGGRAS